ncbi:ABC transporter ATP-binding protein [Paenibacillus sp. KN14-4R]|uniref:ABC transporter ATP-binding protein n=1 Tax=Paenibacillus sp. KN14-4R TaxID=3445773 RepID=UPI003F9FC31D
MAVVPIIELRDVSFTYEAEQDAVLNHVNLVFQAGEWVNIVGCNGSGKTTLCHLIHPILQKQMNGSLQGHIQFRGEEPSKLDKELLSSFVGIVLQSADVTFIHEYVEDELAFGPENLRVPPYEIDERIDEVLCEVGMEGYRKHRIDELSGGQKQRIAIASMLMMRPNILVFDDVTASLDDEATEHFLKTLHNLQQAGHTIVTTSSRLDVNLIYQADQLILLEDGEVVANGPVAEVILCKRELLLRSGCLLEDDGVGEDINLGVRIDDNDKPLLEVKNLIYQYPSISKGILPKPPIFNDINLLIKPGDFTAIMGSNGSGKTTLGKILGGLLRPQQGMVFAGNRDLAEMNMNEITSIVGYIFQDPEHQFVTDRVIEECIFGLKMRLGLQPWETSPSEIVAQGEEWLKQIGLWELKEKNPFTLSSGEKRLLSMASIMISEPEILVLDEPTAGQDYHHACEIMQLCDAYRKRGKAVVMITHDSQMVRKWATKIVHLSLTG